MIKDQTIFQEGQTLIETIAAIFILTTGLVAGLSLAIYAFGSSTDLVQKIAATGLAREGIETVRRMRDSNWLGGALVVCLDIGANQNCYTSWLNQTYNISGAADPGQVYRLNFDPTSVGNKWTLQTAVPTDNFRLYIQSGNTGMSHTVTSQPTNLFRKIEIIQADINPPYSVTSPKLLIRSSVWWYGKNCNVSLTYLSNPNQTFCKVISEENLTNWKNY